MIYLNDPLTWLTVAITALIVMACIGMHFEILSNCRKILKRLSHKRRRRVLILILIILFAHSAEIWLFAIGYWALLDIAGAGELIGAPVQSFADYVYYSGMVYTTVGFGDISPIGPVRFLTGMEALAGLVMITWSASFTFLEMQMDWERQ